MSQKTMPASPKKGPAHPAASQILFRGIRVNQKLKLRFAKRGMMRFISHLDLMRLFQRAARRAALPVTISKGFSPHPRISIQPALKLGMESDALEAFFKLDD